MTAFHPMFSPEWEAERAEFYGGLWKEDNDYNVVPYDEAWTAKQRAEFDKIWERQKDKESVRRGGKVQRQNDREKLRLALAALSKRSRIAAEVLSELLPMMERRGAAVDGGHGIGEVLSDCSLALIVLDQMLSPYGHPSDIEIVLKKRGPGAIPDTFHRVRRALAIGAEMEQTVAAGTSLDSVHGYFEENFGISETTTKGYLDSWQAAEACRRRVERWKSGC